MMDLKRLLVAGALGVVLVWVVGCGPGGPDVQSVTGTVQFADGSPLTQGQIIFVPVGQALAEVSPRGQVKEDGSYTLYTGEHAGAPVGSYKVYFLGADTGGYQEESTPEGEGTEESPPTEEPSGEVGGELLIHSKYLNATTSDLKADVKAGNNDIPFTVDKP
jgi:hypothetical protein